MEIDAKSFFMLVATLAAGGAAGWYASEKHLLPPLEPKAPSPPPAPLASPPSAQAVIAAPDAAALPSASASASASATASASAPAPAVPPCDDTLGTSGDCPPPGLPTVEGGCGSFAATRCAEYKQSMKPRIATEAVACLARLTPQERCNPQRVNLCGHTALMNACPEPDVTSGVDAGARASAAAMCRNLVATCAASAVTLSPIDCERTLAGMTPVGRDRTAACLKKHCFDKGLLFCEAAARPD
jgi:hypothetical protein